MKMTLEMPPVSKCTVTRCAYQHAGSCHARAITIGDFKNPRCDTYFEHQSPPRERIQVAGVGACKVVGCSHNKNFECSARSIEVGVTKDEVKCLTFVERPEPERLNA